ncbi:MAG TPA: LuxR C-terminal-related transcriptional regulator [Gemmatimonadaceae bacterium]|nr:LuxR C-terminal-related transcriptional regulator [Gemmatimonadaceae bacterium]
MIATTEYELLRESAGLVDRSARGKLRLTGAEAAEFLQGQVTNDVEALAPGSGCYAALLTHKGKMQADMRVLRGEDWLLIDSEPETLPAIARMVSMYSIGRDVRSEDRTGEDAILSLVGPGARGVLDAEPPAEEHGWVAGEHGLYVTTDAGVDIICPAGDAEGVRAALGAGARGDLGLEGAADGDLIQAVRSLAAGEMYLSPELAASHASAAAAAPVRPAPESPRLTERERQVLTLVARGRSNREIAEMLGLSANTIAVHRANLMKTLAVRKTASLVLYAVRHGLVTAD